MNRKHFPGITGVLLLIPTLILLVGCANPTDEPPLEWRSRFGIPLTSKVYTIGDEIDTAFDFEDNMEILRESDTVTFVSTRTDTSHYTRAEKTFDDVTSSIRMGTLTIQNAPSEERSAPFAHEGDVTVPLPIPLRNIRSISFFDTSGNILDMNVTNESGFILNNVSVGVAGIDTLSTSTIPSHTRHTFPFNVAGKSVIDTLFITLSFTSPVADAGEIAVQFSMDGLKVDSMNVLDSLIANRNEYTHRYDLNDSIRINYLDIAEGDFIYSVTNHCAIPFLLNSTQNHLWNSDYCHANDLNLIEDLDDASPSADDSLEYFRGAFDTVKIQGNNLTTATINLAGNRLFAEWDEDEKKSYSTIDYGVEVKPVGAYVVVSRNDSLHFRVSASSLKYREITGTIMEPLKHTIDTQTIAVNLPWETTVKDSLKGKFLLEDVMAEFTMHPYLTRESRLDSLRIRFDLFSPEFEEGRDSFVTTLTNVSSDSVYVRTMDLATIINHFPDSISIAANITIPEGTLVRFENDLDWTESDVIGKMDICIRNDFRLLVKCDWTVAEPFAMDLGNDRMEISSDGLEFINKMTDKTGMLILSVLNYTNLNMSLFALAAPDDRMDALDALTMNEMFDLIANTDAATDEGYINLMGESGIEIQKRDPDHYYADTVKLDDTTLRNLLDCDSLSLRWLVRFNEQARDVLRRSDSIGVKSSIEIRGTNNTDSLLTW